MRLSWQLAAVALSSLASVSAAHGAITQFFDAAQSITQTASGSVSDTYSSEGYLFTRSMDKWFTGGVGLTDPVGRFLSVTWPDGLQAQAVTTAPPGGTTSKAQITIKRVDGDVFDLPALTIKLLANTGGAGASLEIMPLLNGQDGLPDPVALAATGYGGQSFSYTTSGPAYIGNTSLLHGFDTYQLSLYVDFALTALTVDGAPLPVVPEPASVGLLALGGALLVLRRKR